MKTLAKIDLSDTKSVQGYEDLLRKRLNRFGYRLSKRKTIQPGPHFIELKQTPKLKGFKITDNSSGSIVTGENYDLPIDEVERFWSKEYEQWCAERRERKRQKEQEKAAIKTRQKNVCVDGGWIVTNDERAICALKDHIAQYGNFDADGHGACGDIWNVMYQAYRPWCCPEFSQVWPVDGDWRNITDTNLKSDADEAALPDGVIPITTQRRIWHNDLRIFIKLPAYDQLFFTVFTPDLFHILCDRTALKTWYTYKKHLYCRVCRKIIAFADVIALFDAGKVNMEDIPESLLEGKRWMQKSGLEVDHLRNNPGNNCPHSIAIMSKEQNSNKNNVLTRILKPFAFVVVRIGENFRVLFGKFGTSDEYFRYIICRGVDQFIDCLEKFYGIAKTSGEMLPVPEDPDMTRCISQMLQDDGMEYHGDQYNVIEGLLRAEESIFTLWDGDVSLLHPDT